MRRPARTRARNKGMSCMSPDGKVRPIAGVRNRTKKCMCLFVSPRNDRNNKVNKAVKNGCGWGTKYGTNRLKSSTIKRNENERRYASSLPTHASEYGRLPRGTDLWQTEIWYIIVKTIPKSVYSASSCKQRRPNPLGVWSANSTNWVGQPHTRKWNAEQTLWTFRIEVKRLRIAEK